MLRSRYFWLALFSAAALIGLVSFGRFSRDNRAVSAPPSAVSAGATAAHGLTAKEHTGRPDDSAVPNAGGLPGALPPYAGPVKNRQRADLLREALGELIAGRLAAKGAASGSTAATASSPPPVMPAPEGEGNQVGKPLGNYIARVMQEQFVPLAVSCYEQLLERSPKAEGKVVLDFSIMGDPSVGGVVVDVSFGKATTIVDTEFATCTRESMLAVIFDAPPEGDGVVTVSQSFDLAP